MIEWYQTMRDLEVLAIVYFILLVTTVFLMITNIEEY